jgi:hypothetical protein
VLVDADSGVSANLERILRAARQDGPKAARILEVNPEHALVRRLVTLHEQGRGEDATPLAVLLLDYARIETGRLDFDRVPTHLREVVDLLGLPTILVPDYSETLDGPSLAQYAPIPAGGIGLVDLRASLAQQLDQDSLLPLPAGEQTKDPGLMGSDCRPAEGVPAGPLARAPDDGRPQVSAEVCAGLKSEFVARVIPSVAYTDPEVAWVGLTEDEAKKQGTAIEVGRFPWAASGRALANGRSEGFTKLIFDAGTHRVVGGGIVGTNAGDLISEVMLALEMGADAADIGMTIHPHPTLSETVAMAAEAFDGTLTDLYIPRRSPAKKA